MYLHTVMSMQQKLVMQDNFQFNKGWTSKVSYFSKDHLNQAKNTYRVTGLIICLWIKKHSNIDFPMITNALNRQGVKVTNKSTGTRYFQPDTHSTCIS